MRTITLCLILSCFAFGQAEKKGPQYKKKNRDLITQLANDKKSATVEGFEKILKDSPNDLEAHYALALAQAKRGKEKIALEHFSAALEGGLPASRFIAGPRTLNQELLAIKGVGEALKDVELVHGPLLGNLRTDGVDVWVRTRSEGEVKVRVLDQIYKAKSHADTDYTAVVKVRGLEEATKYAYGIAIDGKAIELAQATTFRTAAKNPERFHIAFGGGAGYTPWFERMWDTIDAQQPAALLLLGDNVYIDTPEVEETQQYCYYRRQSQPEWSRLVAKTPVFAVWDDHDFGDNDCHGGPAINMPAWKRPVWNVFAQNWANPGYGGGAKQPGVWFKHSIGPVEFFFLDTRYYREKPGKNGDLSMLGPVQRAWFKQALSESRATFKVICTSVPMATNTKPGSRDTWDGHTVEREAIFSHIDENKIEGVFILAADRHRSDLWKIPRPNGYTLTECMSSRLTNVHTHKIMPGSEFGYNKTCSFGMVRFDFSVDDPTATYEIWDIEGKKQFEHVIKRSSLRK